MKSILLDTQGFIYAINSPELLPSKTKKIYNNSEIEIYLSMASIWEMSIKVSLGKLKFSNPLKEIIQTSIKETGLSILPIQAEHLYIVENLPFHHKDPFDRLIAAQALAEKMSLISTDSAFDAYGVQRIW